MPSFSRASRDRLATCDERLQRLFLRVVETFDCAVIEGHRGREAQEVAFNTGRSKAHFGESAHNSIPSRAVDVMPYPVDFSDWMRLYAFGGYVLATAHEMEIPVKWGAKWSEPWERVSRIKFVDAPHFELSEP